MLTVESDRLAHSIFTEADVKPGTEIGHRAIIRDHVYGARTPAGREAHQEHMREHYSEWREVPGTLVLDQTNSSYWMWSNFRRIGEDFADYVLTVGYDSDEGMSLYVRVGDEIPEDLWDFMHSDCAVYDESDASDAYMEQEDNNWNDWGRDEMMRDLRTAHGVDWDEIETERNWDGADFDSIVADARNEGTLGTWVSETSESGYWADWDAWVASVAKIIEREG